MSRARTGTVLAYAATALTVLGAAGCATHRAGTAALYEPPRRLWSPPLAYPESLMQAQVEGSVLLQAEVDTSGRVDQASVRVLKSSNAAFEPPAVEMLRGTRFRPAYSGDRPTTAVIEVPVKFELKNTTIDSVAAAAAVIEGEQFAREGAIPRAMAAFMEAQRLDSRVSSSSAIWSALCRHGSLWGYAQDVIGLCDRWVALNPSAVRARDARGVARALTGDYPGAITDFQAVVNVSTSDPERVERTAWIRALRAGRNPLTPDVIEQLRSRGP
jgi:TonB family protein